MQLRLSLSTVRRRRTSIAQGHFVCRHVRIDIPDSRASENSLFLHASWIARVRIFVPHLCNHRRAEIRFRPPMSIHSSGLVTHISHVVRILLVCERTREDTAVSALRICLSHRLCNEHSVLANRPSQACDMTQQHTADRAPSFESNPKLLLSAPPLPLNSSRLKKI